MDGPDGAGLLGMSQRMPPSNLQAEQAFLGALLANNKVLDRVRGFLLPEHFADPIHGDIYATIARIIEAGRVADTVTLRGHYENRGILDDVGGVSYLAQLLAAMVGIINAREYAKAVQETWLRRRLIEVGEDVVNRAFAGGADAGAVLGEMALQVDALLGANRIGIGARKPSSLLEAMDAALAAADRAASRGGMSGISTGMPSIDRLTGGLENGSMFVLGGRPGSGKSALGHQWAIAAARAGIVVAEFALEMSAMALGRRALAATSGVPIWRMRRGEHAEVIDQLLAARKELADLPISIHDGMRLTAGGIMTKCRAAARTKGLGLILVDHLHLVAFSESGLRHGATVAVTEVVDTLLGAAKEFECPMLLLAQLSRAGEGREDRRPVMSDLRQAGAIEQDADTIGFVWREELHVAKSPPSQTEGEPMIKYEARLAAYFEHKNRVSGKAELLLDKVRDGEPSAVTLEFDGPTASFKEPAR